MSRSLDLDTDCPDKVAKILRDAAQAYIDGWNACMAGIDGRYASQTALTKDEQDAWYHGWLDAMEAEDDEQPEPECAGY